MHKFHRRILGAGAVALLASFALAPGFNNSALAEGLAPVVEESVATIEGVPGGVVTRTASLNAVVEAIDPATRKVTLGDGAGNTRTVTAGPEVVNFDQIVVGDSVHVEYLEELVVYLKEAGAPDADGAAMIAARAPEGGKPGAVIGGTVAVTAVVTAVDLEAHTATLQFPDGSEETFPVRADVALGEDRIGQEVVLQATKAVAAIVEASE